MSSYYLMFIFSSGLILFLLISYFVSFWLSARVVHRSTVQGIHALLNPPHTALEQILLSRAILHNRVVDAFDVDCTFVSADPEIHKSFRDEALSLIDTNSPRGWSQWQTAAIGAVNTYLPESAVSLEDFARAVTFYTVLVGLMGVNPGLLDVRDVILVTRKIDILWRLPETLPLIIPLATQAQFLSEINSHIHQWMPHPLPHPNPLKLIIPAYEAIWRVVANGFVHVYDDPRARLALEDFHDNACDRQFHECRADGPNVEYIIAETLRLFPPTKYISRAIFDSVPTTSIIIPCSTTNISIPILRYEVADIEAVQRSSVWGKDADEFDPSRHDPSRCKPEQKETLLAFGYGPLKCIAEEWAPKATGVILSAMLDRIDGANYKVVKGDKKEMEVWMIRNGAA